MSKTIYMRQLGRGTRKSEGKEYLMVFDFKGNANLFNMPLLLHRLFNIDKYFPGKYVVAPTKLRQLDEDMLFRGEKPEVYPDFPVFAEDYEIIDIFNWQDEVKDLISWIELVRMMEVRMELITQQT